MAQGEKIPRKGGPGITRSDLLVINKIDLAPHVGASLEVMEKDTRRMRGERPFVFTNLKTRPGRSPRWRASWSAKAGSTRAPRAAVRLMHSANSRSRGTNCQRIRGQMLRVGSSGRLRARRRLPRAGDLR